MVQSTRHKCLQRETNPKCDSPMVSLNELNSLHGENWRKREHIPLSSKEIRLDTLFYKCINGINGFSLIFRLEQKPSQTKVLSSLAVKLIKEKSTERKNDEQIWVPNSK